MILVRCGFFREMKHGDKRDPSIFDFIQIEPNNNEEKIYQYLISGNVLIASGGVTYDVIEKSDEIIGCPDILTDGVWLWPKDLAYYVKKYHLKVEDVFANHMENNKWMVHFFDISIATNIKILNSNGSLFAQISLSHTGDG